MDNILVRFDQVTVKFQDEIILNNINWDIHEGSHWAVLGPMNAGKTILGRTLCGHYYVNSGKLVFPFLPDKENLKIRNQQVKMVSFTDQTNLFAGVNADHYYQQRYNAFDSDGHMTALDYLKHHDFDPTNSIQMAVIEKLELKDLLCLERIKLSSGQTRKLILASALIEEPTILWIDNPHAGLDASSREHFNLLIDQWVRHESITIILSGHFDALPTCINHFLYLEEGKTKSIGPDFIPSSTVRPNSSPIPSHVKEYFTRFESEYSGPIISMNNVSIKYADTNIFKPIAWEVMSGEKWALVGSNGSGKSTLLSCIYADHPQVYSNEIMLFGNRRGSGESIWEVKSKIGFTSPEIQTYYRYNFSAWDLVISGLWDRFVVKQAPPEIEKVVFQLFEYFGITAHKTKKYKQLSTGMQRLCFFLRALIKNPPLLLFDEPYQAMDDLTITKANHLLDKVLTVNHTVIFISHFRHHLPGIVKHVFSIPQTKLNKARN